MSFQNMFVTKHKRRYFEICLSNFVEITMEVIEGRCCLATSTFFFFFFKKKGSAEVRKSNKFEMTYVSINDEGSIILEGTFPLTTWSYIMSTAELFIKRNVQTLFHVNDMTNMQRCHIWFYHNVLLNAIIFNFGVNYSFKLRVACIKLQIQRSSLNTKSISAQFPSLT